MASSIPANPTSQTVAALLPKLNDADSDFRFMSLNDLYTVLTTANKGILAQDPHTSARTIEGILKTLDDQNGEVQNLAIKCLGPLVLKLPPTHIPALIDRLSKLSTEHSVDSSIPATALRTVVTTFPRPAPGVAPSKATEDAYAAISRVLIPRLVGVGAAPQGGKNANELPGLLQLESNKGVDGDAVDVLIEVVRCFGPMLRDVEIHALYTTVIGVLEHDRTSSVVKKRAVVAISVLASYFSDDVLSSFVSHLIEKLRSSHLTPVQRRLYITIIGSVTRSIPQRFGVYLKTLAPFVLSAVSEDELAEHMERLAEDGEPDVQGEEVREAAFIALEGFLASCSGEMRIFTAECINAALIFLKHDPNFNDADEEMGGTQNGEEDDEDDDLGEEEAFEAEEGFSDDEDISWKVRRCAAKMIYTLIQTRASGDLLEDGTLYDKVAPVLVERFKEREDSVRLEIFAAMSTLIRKTGEGGLRLSSNEAEESHLALMGPPQSRKRRRGGSDASMFDTQASISMATGVTSPPVQESPFSGPQASLAALSPAIVRSLAKLLKAGSIASKQASLALLRDVVAAQNGGLEDALGQLIDPLVDAIKATGGVGAGSTVGTGPGTGGSATVTSLRIEALNLAAAIAETHSSDAIVPYLDKLVPSVLLAARDKYYRVSSNGLATAEQLAKVLTPPRSPATDPKRQHYLNSLYDTIVDRVNANDADTEVRQCAIHALGVLLARASGPDGSKLLSPEKRTAALDVLYERLRSEITRMAAVKAIDTVASLTSPRVGFHPAWTKNVSLELGAQLRKANRLLRGASLGALKNLVASPAGKATLDGKTVLGLVDVLSPLLTTSDLHLLGPTLVVLAHLVKGNAKKVVNENMIASLCALVVAPLGGAVLDALLILTQTIGEEGMSKPLMEKLLKDVGVNGDPGVVGKVIGTLLVSGGNSVGVTINDFISELSTAQDDQRKCLALAVLGESGLRMGTSSPLDPELFMKYFQSKSDQVPLTAAVSLGRAGAGDITKYLPVILKAMDGPASQQYLLLHSIKEILQHAGDAMTDIAPQSRQIWDKLILISQAEDNRAVGAECIGRLAIVDAKNYLPSLENYLTDREPGIRGMVIQAVRYTFVDTDDTYDEILKPILIGMLTTILNDVDLENRRLALTTLNSALHNKPGLILPHLGQLAPLVIKESVINPDLLREVQMGPFKHNVDGGLELRKSAYETLFAVMETGYTRINVVSLYDRVMAGLEDDHDIRVLCNLMLSKLITLDPEETFRRLDSIGERFQKILSQKPKDNAVKQEIEKQDEAAKGVLNLTVHLNRTFPVAGGTAGAQASGGLGSAQGQVWRGYWEWVRKEMNVQLKAIEEGDAGGKMDI
ncbi:MAG: hypothetical protein M4579_005761 [Chaenotheca gracillima]|nr:MAG: hypothetical protein M4579_005761 [Chaenotheca gracillima]